MSCKYCDFNSNGGTTTIKKIDGTDVYAVEYDIKNNKFDIFVWGRDDHNICKVSNVKYCPFCGGEFTKPSKEILEQIESYHQEWEKEREARRKEQAKKEREHQKWLEREYKKNPYDPTKPRLKDKNFRNAVKYLAKYMGVKEFYWDDDMRRLTGWDGGGYIDLENKTIGPCYETNGVMESFHDSGKCYSVEELCYGHKNEK